MHKRMGMLLLLCGLIAQAQEAQEDVAPRVESMRIGLSDEQRSGVIALLQPLLADEYILYTKTQQFHWNVTGPFFDSLHQFFGKQYEEIQGIIDMVAERIRSLGGTPVASLQEFLAVTRLQEHVSKPIADQAMLALLLADHETIIRSVRHSLQVALDQYQDAGTNNFLTDLVEQHEKMAWMLRASRVQSK